MKTKPGLFFLLVRLAKDRRGRGHRLLARLWRDEEGSWLISMTLVLPVLIGVAGLGTEGGMLFYQHRSLQSAADAAAYSAAISYSYDNNTTNMQNQAKAVVASYGYTLGTGTDQASVTATATTFASLTAVQVSISRPQSAIFSSIYLPTLQNSVSATAVINGGGGGGSASGGCMLALGKDKTSGTNNEADAIKLQGNPTINASKCGIFSDSTDCVAGSFSESLGGNATINAGSLASAGCHTIFGHAQINLPGGVTCNSSNSTACTQGDGTISDPYAGITLPSTPAPPCATANPSGGSLGPGRYCGLNVNGTSITLTGGVYILDCTNSTCPSAQGTSSMLIVKNASLTVASGASATLVFTCSTCTSASQWPSNGLLLAAGGSISLNAPTTGATAGFVMIGDPAMPLNTLFDTHSNPSACLMGTVYAPNAEFDYGGTPTTGCTGSSSSFCLQLIANTIDLYGNASLNGAGCSLSGGGTGGPVQKPIGSTVTLVD
jgi:Flp pilus assembly protein TadG